ncbi:MAG TPA: 16S rRNA (cytidine(1402)-2'-O)-methyltransferase [Polyangiaceae bacterium]|nr:16S rRNA (cytidine(1402)-2'-O)-methyltransferase [Polyangiaceae bacterium]
MRDVSERQGGGGTLFVVATPIGNLGDMTERALETLRVCDRVLAEDTRRTRHLLTHFGIGGKRLDRFDAHASERDVARAVEMLGAGERVALVTDAGTPGVSDPAEALVEAAIDAGARVVPIPGASAVLAALVASGLAADGRFRFVGFLPREGRERRASIALVCETPEAVVLFESPNRTGATLRELADATPERRVCVARELTKLHEELVRGTLADVAGDPREWLGEIAIVLGVHAPEERDARLDDAAVDARIDEALARGEHLRTIAERLAAWSGRPKRELYARVVSRKKRE